MSLVTGPGLCMPITGRSRPPRQCGAAGTLRGKAQENSAGAGEAATGTVDACCRPSLETESCPGPSTPPKGAWLSRARCATRLGLHSRHCRVCATICPRQVAVQKFKPVGFLLSPTHLC